MNTLYLGVGAQKAGTTWIFQHLINSGRFVEGITKEYHALDSIYFPYLDNYEEIYSDQLSQYQGMIKQLSMNRLLALFTGKTRKVEKKIRMLRRKEKQTRDQLSIVTGENNYFDHIVSLFDEKNTMAIDVTPSYSALTELDYHDIKSQFNQRNVQVKIFFIMRDPVCRLESSIRMRMRNDNILETGNRGLAIKDMISYCHSIHEDARSNYMRTVSSLDNSFESEDVFIGFYEKLFDETTINRLSMFFGVNPACFNPEYVANASERMYEYPREFIDYLAYEYRDIYRFVYRRYPEVIDIWSNHRDMMVENLNP